MGESFNIRPAQLDDAPAILSIYNNGVLSGRSTGHLKPVKLDLVLDWLDQASSTRPFWVAERSNQVVAWMGIESFYGLPAFQSSVEVSVYVDPGYRRQGIARKCLDYLEKSAQSLGISHLIAFIYAHNQASIELFDAFAYQRWGVMPCVAELEDGRMDLLILGKILTLLPSSHGLEHGAQIRNK